VTRSYLAAVGADYQAIMDARVPRINAALVEAEAGLILAECPDDFTLNEQTGPEFASKLWAAVHSAYHRGDKFTYHRLVWRVWAWTQNGRLTSEQVRLSFNSFFGTNYTSGASWNGFTTTRLVPIKDRYLALVAEAELA
jgi:hypothetical protein